MHEHEGWSQMQSIGATFIHEQISEPLSASLAPAEYGYYFAIFYSVLGPPLGLILAGGVGTGYLLIPVLAWCVLALGQSIMSTLRQAWMPLACGVSYLFIQLVLHGVSLQAMYVYQFGPWLFSLVIVQALVIYRPNFLHRFAWFTFFLGVATLPFMSFMVGGGPVRMGLDREIMALANPNALAGWFGFCALYLMIKGYIEKRPPYRMMAWLMSVVSLYIVLLTVSRGALLAVSVSLLIGSRRLLKAGILPVLLLACLLLGLMEIGLFDEAIQSYSRRGVEDTGRLKVWPLLIEMFLSSPEIGVGASHAGAFVSSGKFVTPHNGFLLFAVASGIVPLGLFCAYLFRSGKAALLASASDRDSVFYLPLVLYAVMITSSGNMVFMDHWAVVSLALPVAALSASRMSRGKSSELCVSSLRPEEIR
jgi:hypothetical protein